MPAKVKLSDILEGLEMVSDETYYYLNKETGEVILLTEEDFSVAGNEEVFENIPDWQRENIKAVRELEDTDKYVPLPDKYDINEYNIMERFCLSITDEKISDELYHSIKGSGAFRRFKENIYRYGIENDWYKYRDQALKEIAIDWCRENGIEFVDE